MLEPVAIVGVGQTKVEANKVRDRFEDMVFEVTNKALADAGMTIADIDNVATVSNDFFDGRTISSMAIGDACGSYDKNISTLEGDGAFGAVYGLMRTLAGTFETTLVVAHHKGSESVMRLITSAMFDPIYERSLGLDAIGASALQAGAYMRKYGVTEEQCAMVSVKNHANAKKNPYAQLPLDLTVEQVMASEMLSDPIKKLDCCPIGDGAAAIILARGDRARKAKKPVWVKGVGYCCDAFHLGYRDLAEAKALEAAAKKAYGMAGISDPAKQINLVELHDAFSYQEPMWLEGLGFCGKGEGGKLTESGKTALSGEFPVSASGGCLSSNPVLVAGLVRIIECALQIRGEAGEHQVDGVRTALAHGVNGPAGQSHCVWVLGGEA
ncbi:MAG: thiolase C-terminal domain-containing protein [Candidatus Geothermincolia bacterium]